MGAFNDFKDTKLDVEEKLVKQYFGFLVDEYGFIYKKYNFRSAKILIQVEPGHKTPRVYIFKIGEPTPDLFRLNFEWIIQYLTGSLPSDKHEYLNYSLEQNMIFISKMFYEHSYKLINEIDDWWIPVHLFCYRTTEKNAMNEGQTERFYKNEKYYYDYLKSKGAL